MSSVCPVNLYLPLVSWRASARLKNYISKFLRERLILPRSQRLPLNALLRLSRHSHRLRAKLSRSRSCQHPRRDQQCYKLRFVNQIQYLRPRDQIQLFSRSRALNPRRNKPRNGDFHHQERCRLRTGTSPSMTNAMIQIRGCMIPGSLLQTPQS
jgi:hypothetical protein